MEETLKIVKALSDSSRLRALAALRGGELCVCQIIELLGLAPSTVSKHMSLLREAGLVEGEKRGRWVYYKLKEAADDPERAQLLDWVFNSIKDTRQVKGDLERIRKITCEI